VKEPPKREVLTKFACRGQDFYVCGDGRLWRHTSGLFEAVVPCKQDKFLELQGLDPKEVKKTYKSKLTKLTHPWPPKFLIAGLLQAVLKPHEVYVVMGAKDSDKGANGKVWMFSVPKQNVGSGIVEVKDLSKAGERLTEQGFDIIGTLHTHPGGGSGISCSSKDRKDLFEEWDGLHLIGNKGGHVARYVSIPEGLFKFDSWQVKLDKKKMGKVPWYVVNEKGKPDLESMYKKWVPTVLRKGKDTKKKGYEVVRSGEGSGKPFLQGACIIRGIGTAAEILNTGLRANNDKKFGWVPIELGMKQRAEAVEKTLDELADVCASNGSLKYFAVVLDMASMFVNKINFPDEDDTRYAELFT